jgi:hypothetical protein
VHVLPKSPPYHVEVSNFRPFYAAPKPISYISLIATRLPRFTQVIPLLALPILLPTPMKDSQPRTRVERICGAVTTFSSHVFVIRVLPHTPHGFLLFSSLLASWRCQPYCLPDAALHCMQGVGSGWLKI